MPGEWHTPVSSMQNMTQIYEKLENYTPTMELDLDKEISYFNNPRAVANYVSFDQFFAYTKTFPLYDPRKEKENEMYAPCIRETIFQQEWPKPVPALSSMNYGKRPLYDHPGGVHNRRSHIANFYRRGGEVITTPEKSRFMEDIEFNLG